MPPDGLVFNFRHLRLARQYLLTTVALICLAGSAQAQIPNLLPAKPATDAVKPAEAPAPGDQRAAAEALLAEARRQQEAARLEDGSAPATDDLPANERQRVLDRLVLVYGERVNLIDETATLKKSAAEMQDKPALATEFSGPPPYPTLRIDALRDEFDLMRERLKHRESTRLVLETQKQGLIEAQRRASEALRLADDRLARTKGETELKKERANRELAALRLQLSEAELTNVGIVLQGAQAEIQALELSTAETQRLVTRVLASQT